MKCTGMRGNGFGVRLMAVLSAGAVLVCLSGCNTGSKQTNDQQLQQQAAKTTQDVKAGAKVAAADAKVAAANAERKLNDIAAGVREGLKGDAPADNGKPSAAHRRVDLNAASAEDIAALPGISGSKAQDIVDGRPYGKPHDLVKKGLLTERQYQRISAQVAAD